MQRFSKQSIYYKVQLYSIINNQEVNNIYIDG